MGPVGARVRCPACGRRFTLDARGEPAESRADASLARAAALSALERVRDLDRPSGALAEAVARGRLFAEFGPALLDAFDDYRRGLDPDASAAEFREAIRLVAGVDLTPRRVDPGVSPTA